jgi:hypothetical protein
MRNRGWSVRLELDCGFFRRSDCGKDCEGIRADHRSLLDYRRQFTANRAAACLHTGRQRRRMHAAVVACRTSGRLAPSKGEKQRENQHDRHTRPLKYALLHASSVALFVRPAPVTWITRCSP